MNSLPALSVPAALVVVDDDADIDTVRFRQLGGGNMTDPSTPPPPPRPAQLRRRPFQEPSGVIGLPSGIAGGAAVGVSLPEKNVSWAMVGGGLALGMAMMYWKKR